MSREEELVRAAAWTWCAEVLGQPLKPNRLKALVEITDDVPAEHLKGAIRDALNESEAGFLPSPGLVKKHAKRLASVAYEQRKRLERDNARRLALAEGKPGATPEQIEEIREWIAGLSRQARMGGDSEGNEIVHGWRPRNALKSEGTDGEAGLAAVRELMARRANGEA